MYKPVEALEQSFLRTKADRLRQLPEGGRAEGQFLEQHPVRRRQGRGGLSAPAVHPARDDRFDYTKPVDGSDPATDWKGLHALSEAPHVKNPPNGWLMNTNNWPYSAAGPYSPKQADFPRYMDSVGETPRGVHATRVLSARKDFTLPTLIEAAYDPYLTAFADLIPTLVEGL
jgi:acyl-homoserine-lactone acylase